MNRNALKFSTVHRSELTIQSLSLLSSGTKHEAVLSWRQVLYLIFASNLFVLFDQIITHKLLIGFLFSQNKSFFLLCPITSFMDDK